MERSLQGPCPVQATESKRHAVLRSHSPHLPHAGSGASTRTRHAGITSSSRAARQSEGAPFAARPGSTALDESLRSAGDRAFDPTGRPLLRRAPVVHAARDREHGSQSRRPLAAAHGGACAGRAAQRQRAAVRVRIPGRADPGPLRLRHLPRAPVQAVRLPARIRGGLPRRAGRLRLLGTQRPRRAVRADPEAPAAGGLRRRQDPDPGQLRQAPGRSRDRAVLLRRVQRAIRRRAARRAAAKPSPPPDRSPR